MDRLGGLLNINYFIKGLFLKQILNLSFLWEIWKTIAYYLGLYSVGPKSLDKEFTNQNLSFWGHIYVSEYVYIFIYIYMLI